MMFTEKNQASAYGNNFFPLKSNNLSLFIERYIWEQFLEYEG